MIQKTITYDNLFDESTVTETHFFHLSKANLIEMEVGQKKGLEKYLEEITNAEDRQKIYGLFKEIILMSYGIRSEDGKKFVKSAELRKDFENSEAFSALISDLVSDTDKAAEFINGVVPRDMAAGQSAVPKPVPTAEVGGDLDEGVPLIKKNTMTRKEAMGLSKEEFNNRFRTGWTIADDLI